MNSRDDTKTALITGQVVAKPERSLSQKIIFGFLSLLVVATCTLVSLVGFYCVTDANHISDTGTIVVSCYMIFLSAILFAFEIVQVKPCDMLDNIFKRNYGFLYNCAGKGIYVIL